MAEIILATGIGAVVGGFICRGEHDHGAGAVVGGMVGGAAGFVTGSLIWLFNNSATIKNPASNTAYDSLPELLIDRSD